MSGDEEIHYFYNVKRIQPKCPQKEKKRHLVKSWYIVPLLEIPLRGCAGHVS